MKRTCPKLFICLCSIVLSAANGLVAFGQMPDFQLLSGITPPDSGRPGMWFHDPNELGRVYAYHDGRWVLLDLPDAIHPKEIDGFVWIQNGPFTALATIDGRLLMGNIYRYQQFEALVIGTTSSGIGFAVRTDGDTLSLFGNSWGNAYFVSQQLEDGTAVFCLPAFGPGTKKYNDSEMRAWGMLDGQGNWRIAPIFDDFFHFDLGRAHVMRYGLPHTINERGEFVE